MKLFSACARAPASIANLGCLFDVAALAVDAYWDVACLELLENDVPRVELEVRGEWAGGLPSREKNLAYLSLLELSRELGLDLSRLLVKLRLEKGVPIARGLGSSAATIAAVASLVAHATEAAEDRRKLVALCGRLEGLLGGSPHYDNVAAALLGGLVVLGEVRSGRPNPVRVPWPEDLVVVIATPLDPLDYEEGEGLGKTGVMRSILPSSIELGEVVEMVSCAASFVEGLRRGDLALVGRAVSCGGPIEKARAKFVRGYWELKEGALKRGALGFNLSGAGPSVFALASRERAEEVADEILSKWSRYYSSIEVRLTRPAEGALSEHRQLKFDQPLNCLKESASTG
ncbi:MAG: homoserine kinase [Fervidicoccaceae archaeon]